MGRASTKENKSIYQQKREELGLTREKAGDLLVALSPERIEKIENGKTQVHPEDVLIMAEGYGAPTLNNYYCSHECPIGQKYVPELEVKDLSKIVLEMLASMNSLHRDQERLIDIAADDEIGDDELEDFIRIQENLERMSMTVDTLQLWSQQMLSSGKIDREAYERLKNK
ncbi:MAG: helix-turn-helix domain-containing protein [Clostridia bacterium]|nr:helix-turn-helix domain-containing protein [Clostridia bacterium]MBP5458925.1 helix-turn-helix domain-containing protein [Clostridia bacterium]